MNIRPIVVGYDGSPQSRSAVGWAATEAALRGLPLHLVQAVSDPGPWQGPTDRDRARLRRSMAALEQEIRVRHGIDVTGAQSSERAAQALQLGSADATALVLGSRGLSGAGGFVAGSVSIRLLDRASVPVVLVRGVSDRVEDGPARPYSEPADVVVGLDLGHPWDSVLDFAFDAAALRGTGVHVLHVVRRSTALEHLLQPSDEGSAADAGDGGRQLDAALAPYRKRYPDVPVETSITRGHVTVRLVDAAAEGKLLVVGRGTGTSSTPRLGPIVQAAVHHARCPVAVIPSD